MFHEIHDGLWILGAASLQTIIAYRAQDNNLPDFVADAKMRLPTVSGLTRLRRLVLRSTELQDGDSAVLAKLTNLTALDVSHTLLKDDDVQQLSALFRLDTLHLSCTRALAPPLLPSLTELAMDACGV